MLDDDDHMLEDEVNYEEEDEYNDGKGRLNIMKIIGVTLRLDFIK